MKLSNKKTYYEKEFEEIELFRKTLIDTEFDSCTFTSCDFSNTKFINCTFIDCTFKKCNLSNIRVPNSKFEDPTFESSKLIGIDWTVLRTEMGLKFVCTNSDLSYCAFERLDIKGSVFSECKLHEADFTSSNMSFGSFEGSDLLKTIFDMTALEKTDFSNAVNYIFDPSKNKLKGAIFTQPEVLNLLEVYRIRIK